MAGNERRFRVVYRDGELRRALGVLDGVAPTRPSLDPYLSRLLLAGVRRGELALVDERTGRVVVRRAVEPRRDRR